MLVSTYRYFICMIQKSYENGSIHGMDSQEWKTYNGKSRRQEPEEPRTNKSEVFNVSMNEKDSCTYQT